MVGALRAYMRPDTTYLPTRAGHGHVTKGAAAVSHHVENHAFFDQGVRVRSRDEERSKALAVVRDIGDINFILGGNIGKYA